MSLVRWSRGSAGTIAVVIALVLAEAGRDEARAGTSSDPVVPLTEGFENGYRSFTSVGNCCVWRVVDSQAYAGSNSIHAEDAAEPGEITLLSTSVGIPANASAASLSFWHMYDFEYTLEGAYDGGVIEVSTDSGRTWVDAEPNLILNSYTGTIAAASSTNPLRGRRAWVERSGAWTQAMVNLTPYRGLGVRFRLRLGTDAGNVTTPGGWWVDDVQVSYSAPLADCGRRWSTVRRYPADVDTAAAVGLSDSLYVFGGRTSASSGAVASAYHYSTQTDTWTLIAALPEPRINASVVTDGTSIYILGGFDADNSATNTFWRYDPNRNNYTTLRPLTIPTASQAAVYLDGMIYRIGGLADTNPTSTRTEPTNSVEVYSIASNSWSDAADYPSFIFGLSAFTLGGYIYTAGGGTGNDVLAKTYRYDPSEDLWDDGPISDLPDATFYSSAALYGDTWILARVGLPFAWDSRTNRWRSLDQAPQLVSQPAAAATADGFYIIAGGILSQSGNSDTVQRYSETDCTAPPTPTRPPGAGCLGDCNGDGVVAIGDLVRGVAILLGRQPIDACRAMDGDQNGEVAVNELVRAVNNALNDCPE